MKIKLIATIIAGLLACNSSTPVRRINAPTVAELTEINMAAYNPTRPTPPRNEDFSLQNILGEDQARTIGASQIYIYSLSEENTRRPFVRGPWNGVCINESAINYIAANTRQAIALTQEEQFVRTQTIAAQAQRDIALMQSDYRLMREAYLAQIRSYEISLTEADNRIVSLRRNNIWQNIGIGIGSTLLGAIISGIILLTR